MNMLFVNCEPDIAEEIGDYIWAHKNQAFFARNTEAAIRALNQHEIGFVVLNIYNLRDAAILRYINEHYRETEVLILANQEYDEIISLFKTGRYHLMRQPIHLSELKKTILSSSKCLEEM